MTATASAKSTAKRRLGSSIDSSSNITTPHVLAHVTLSRTPIESTMSTDIANDPEILAHVKKFWEGRKPSSPIYQFLLDDIKLTHASKGLVRARLALTKNHVNTHGSIHGSVSATLVDWVGGLAIAAWDNRTKTGVSTDIHISYQSGAKDGDTIEIEGRAGKVGGSLAFTTATIWKLVDDKPGPIVATGSHTKYVK
ncbi:Thioesterase/thiol ester dehydrase-isomerase [Clathrospora elynae]|uniref:Thioesterase/thiol ester dehydrase-isomerase n=1 Tax=Clathrospora elynae TaxID=706981 RepID=A0A6A5SNY0_9PLEO|nr:Thioesterase/thiol ester dehydrase-isomerase [Clathrospora elynae]